MGTDDIYEPIDEPKKPTEWCASCGGVVQGYNYESRANPSMPCKFCFDCSRWVTVPES